MWEKVAFEFYYSGRIMSERGGYSKNVIFFGIGKVGIDWLSSKCV